MEDKYDLEGIANAVEILTDGIENKAISDLIYVNIARALERNPLRNARWKYQSKRDGIILNWFKVFHAFNCNGKTIDPKQAVDEFFENTSKLYGLIIYRVSSASDMIAKEKNQAFSDINEYYEWSRCFKYYLEKEIELAQDIALWLSDLPKREKIGLKAKEKLKEYGITNPGNLFNDVTRLGKNIKKIYNAVEKQQLEKYQ